MAGKIATRQAYGEVLEQLGEANQNIVVLDADLSKSTMTAGFSQKYPNRFFNIGIAEQNMYGIAAGLATTGKTVFASTFAMFASGRAFEIIRNSIGYTRLNVKVCATHAGITVGEDGASHQAIEDLALMRTIPGMTVINPSDAVSTKELIIAVSKLSGPVYVRLGRAGVPVIYGSDDTFKIGKALTLREGTGLTIIATGIMVHEALQAAEQLAEKGKSVRVIDMHTIKPIDEQVIIRAAKETGAIITAEEHSVIGGLGSAVAEVLSQHYPARLKMIGINDTFGESGKPDELMKKYGLTAADLVNAAENF